MMDTIKKGAGIQSLEVGLSILDLISSHGQPLTFTAIHEGTKITKSNLYKYLNTLTSLGLLYRDKFHGLYSLGSKLIQYGMSAVSQENVVEKVAPYLQDISRICKETVFLSVWTQEGPMIIRMINSNQLLNIGATIGSYLPLQSATGEIYAAFLEEYQLREWKEKELAYLSKEEQQTLMEELEQIRRKRISFRSGSLVSSVSAVAVPIFNYQNKLLGVISLVGFVGTISDREDDQNNQYVSNLSREISQVFGYERE